MRSRLVYRWGFAVLGLSAAANLVVAVRVFFAMQNPVAYNIRVFEPPVYTNVVASLPILPPMPGVSTNQAPQPLDVSADFVNSSTNYFEAAVEAYHYMRVDGRPLFRLNGRNYAVGDTTAYGNVDRIFPERIYLDDGGYITNLRRVFDIAEFAVPVRSDPSPSSRLMPQVKPSEESPHDPS